MNVRNLHIVATCLTVMALLASACAPAAAPTAAPKATTAPAATAKPGATVAAPSLTPKPAAEQPALAGGILKQAAYADEATFDLHVTGRTLAFEQASLSYSGLLQYDPEDGTKIIPDLAESFQVSPDGKKVTFVLRKDVKWHDGKAFNSEDVKFNFDRWMKPPEGVIISRKELVANVDRVETPSANTVEVYMKNPSPAFIPLIAMPPADMLPPQYLKDRKTMEYNILGTGPYKLKRYTRGVSVEHVKNPDYFVKDRPYLDGIVQYLVPDSAARFAALRTGQIRITFIGIANITASQADLVRTQLSDKINVARFLGLGLTIVYMNLTRPPFNNDRVRQAVDMVLDRKKVIDVAEGKAAPSAMMPPGPWALPDDELAKRPGYKGVTAEDIAKAKALLAEAGYPDGFKVTAVTTSNPVYTRQAVFLQDQLKAIGVQVTIESVDQPTWDRRMLSGDFDIFAYSITAPINDPDTFLAFAVTGGGRNYSKFSDKQVDDWYQEQSRTMDAAKRKEITLNVQRRILDLAAMPVLYTVLMDLPYWKCLKGFYPEKQIGYSNNVKRQDVWLTADCR